MRILLLVFLGMVLASCNEEVDTQTQNSDNNDTPSNIITGGDTITIGESSIVDVGSNVPLHNLPLEWIFVEYPELNNNGSEFISFSPCEFGEVGLTGNWVIVREFAGAFFRTEGGKANPFNSGYTYDEATKLIENGETIDDSNFSKMQNSSVAHHFHHHRHSHSHNVDDNHTHKHTHEPHAHSVTFGTAYKGALDDAGAQNDPFPDRFEGIDTSEFEIDAIEDILTVFNCTLRMLPDDDGNFLEVCGDLIDEISISPNSQQFVVNDAIPTQGVLSDKDETRPRNSTARVWQRIFNNNSNQSNKSIACSEFEYVYEKQYRIHEGKKTLVSSKRKIDSNGNYLIRGIEPNKNKPKIQNKKYIINGETDTDKVISKKYEEKIL